MPAPLRLILAAALVVPATGCAQAVLGVALATRSGGGGGGGGGAGAPGPTAPSASMTVGPAGGTVTAAQGVRIQVPAGALAAETTFTVGSGSTVAGADHTAIGGAWTLGPSGMSFKAPLTVELPWDPALLPAGFSAGQVVVLKRDDATGQVTVLTPSAGATTLTVQVSSFSTVQPVVVTAVDRDRSTVTASPTAVAADGTSSSTITVLVVNPAGHPLPNRQVDLALASGAAVLTQPGPTDGAGRAAGTVRSTSAGSVTIVARVAPQGAELTQRAAVTFTAPPPPPPPPPPADDHRNDATTTSNLTLGAPAAGRIEVALDRDWFRVQLTAGQTYVLRTRNLSAGFDTTLVLRDAAGNELASNDDDPTTPGSHSSRIQYTPTTTGAHYLEVWGFLQTTGTYEVLAVGLTPGAAEPSRSTVAAPGDSALVGGAGVQITVTVRAADGSPLTGRTVVLSTTGSATYTLSQPGSTDGSGVATGNLASADAGLRVVTAVVDGVTVGQARVSFHDGQNRCLAFDGGDALVLPGASAAHQLGTQFTFECWLKLTAYDPDGGFLFNKWQVAVEDKIFHAHDGYPSVGHAGPDTNVTSATRLTLNRWTHVAGCMDGAGMRIYVDGRLVASNTRTGDMKDASGPARIGRYLRDNRAWGSITGLLDEVRLSKVARYTADFTPPKRLAADADTYLMLHFDEGTGTAAGDTSRWAEDGAFGAGTEAPRWVVEEIVQAP